MSELLPRQPDAPEYMYAVMRDDGKYMAGMPYLSVVTYGGKESALFPGIWTDRIVQASLYRNHGTAQAQATKCKQLGIEARVIRIMLSY